MKQLLFLGISSLAIMVSASVATGATTVTKAQAFKSARVCLLQQQQAQAQIAAAREELNAARTAAGRAIDDASEVMRDELAKL